MKVLFHGRLVEAIGRTVELNDLPGCTVGELRERLISDHPEAEQSLLDERVVACIGDRLVTNSYALQAGETIEFLPPVSGG